MDKKIKLIVAIGAAVVAPSIITAAILLAQNNFGTPAPRPEGPCDIYAAAGMPCAAAHSTTRALYASYNGPLYQVVRASDGQTLDIGVAPGRGGDAGGYANAAAQDAFCANTYCYISIIYDQSPYGNHLIQAPRGAFLGPAMGGLDNVPVADMAPVSLNGHKVYGTFIIPGMGMRWNDPTGTAVDDLAEGQYWVINGHHYNDGCCFDYGNAETDSRDDGDGTMETTYFGNTPLWYHGQEPGPWLMTDQENNLVGCVTDSPNNKFCDQLKSIPWRFATETVDGEPHHWRSMAGNAQGGALETLYDGIRIENPRNSYDPMRKQGAILLGNGGDNGNVSSGTYYEGAMTVAGTFPTEETNQAIQANVVAAHYDVAALQLSAADKTAMPSGVQTWALNTTQNVTVRFTNTIGEPVVGLTLTVVTPKGWKSNVLGEKNKVKSIPYIAPGESVYVTFAVTSGSDTFNGDLQAKANWNSFGKTWSETTAQKVRNVEPVKINEFRITDHTGNKTNSFIELYNPSEKAVNLAGWTMTEHTMNVPYFSTIEFPHGATIPAKGFYLMGLANSGLAVDAPKGSGTIYVRDLTGMQVGDEIEIGSGNNKEVRKIQKIYNSVQDERVQGTITRGYVAPGYPSFVFQPLPNGPDDKMFETFPAGSTSLPVTSVAHFKVGDKVALGYGAVYPAFGQTKESYEVVTVTAVGKPGTQAYTSYEAKPGDTVLRVSNVTNISVGDQILLDINSQGHGKELVTVKAVGTASTMMPGRGPMELEQAGTGLTLTEPLKYNHAANTPFAVNGTGISFTPATKYQHMSNEPVLALVYAIDIDMPLDKAHAIDEVVYDAKVKDAGYQGEVAADMLFGGPALLANGGNMVLKNEKGEVVDALSYGRVVDVQYTEGYHGESGTYAMGAYTKTPSITGNGGYNTPEAGAVLPNLSAGRYPDGNDTDNNKYDFFVQPSFNLAADLEAQATTINLVKVDGLVAGSTIYLGDGSNFEAATVATVGTAGATKVVKAAKAGDKEISVVDGRNFAVGQFVLVGDKLAKIADITLAPRRRMMPAMPGMPAPAPQPDPIDVVTLAAGIDAPVAEGCAFTGTGVMLAAPLKNAHKAGEALAVGIPTPGQPNKY